MTDQANVPTNEDFITGLYRALLYREPDADGFDYWLDLLNTEKASRKDVVIGFIQSEEARVTL